MSAGLLILAHAPLASALRSAALHVFPEAALAIGAVDVPPDEAPEQTLVRARAARAALGEAPCLVFADVYGASPCNVARRLADSPDVAVVAGVNLPMLLRTVNYRHETLEALVQRALAGGVQCMLRVPTDLPCNNDVS
ncbi:MAG: PTS sugar transporter subunit IIA [Rhodoferax sp.]